MLSNKWTFSLTSFVVCLMIAFVGTAMGDGDEFSAAFTPGELMVDVSATDHAGFEDIQIESGRNRASTYPDSIDAGPFDVSPGTTGPAIVFAVNFGKVVQLHDVGTDTVAPSGGALGLDDFVVEAFDDLGRSLGAIDLRGPDGATGTAVTETDDLAVLSFNTPRLTPVRDPGELPGQQFLLKVRNTALVNAYDTLRGGSFEIHTLLFQLKHAAVVDASLAIRQDVLSGKEDVKIFHSEGPKFLRVDLVEEDEGFAQYANITGTTTAVAAEAGDPGVIAITRVHTLSGIAATAAGPFDVRIVLTEEPAAFTAANINVNNGTASDPVALLPIAESDLSAADFPLLGYTTKAPASAFGPGATVADTPFPNPTGRDNMYHVYSVTITPTPGHTGRADVIVNGFDDKVLPASDTNRYVGLTRAELLADTLSNTAVGARDTRAQNGREVLSVSVGAPALADIFKPSADAMLTHEKFINEKLVIPANGYLVLASGAYAQAGVLASAAKLADKKRVGETLYNTVEKFDPPYPGDDLANLFRNGATIQLAYQNISGNDAAADAAGADDTGYDGASDDVYTAGTVIINEIMWGYDRGLDNRAYTEGQWIELHNTTAAPISLDKQEWMLVYGATTSFAAGTVIDTVSNNPSTGYWKVPGQSGVSSSDPVVKTGVAVEVEGTKEDIQILDRDIVDVVSISRVAGGPDGTAASSWATSILPSANFSSVGRIGTPGATNVYDTSLQEAAVAADEAADEDAVSKAPVAAGTDLMITEIMVASNDGRLPQWIEIANVSAAAVSVSGWSLEVDNDSADADVVGAGDTIVIDLGDVEIGVDQVALVVTKEGRDTSGIGDGEGDLRADRIINVQSAVSPNNARYSLISEMGFMISLIPPQTGAVRKPGDVVGNLDGGWELPMSEGDRSSLIRREMGDAGEIMGTDVAGWVLASDTMLGGAYLTTYYGSADDMGTPGYNAGGNLPVELSGFGAKRDPLTGAVVITWSTQSELNNAGFFIKRSQQTNGKFVIVNPTMIAGAGTTAEKQSYTYTDATAEPNIVYYYQIEDVSLDGNRQTLTRAHRLKGHVGAAGKATTTWGELKSSRD